MLVLSFPKETFFKKSRCHKILHIGGHKGQEGPIYGYMRLAFTFVEPMPRFARLMRRKGYRVIQKAVSSKEGSAVFKIAKVSERSSLRQSDSVEVARKIPVKTTTLAKIQRGYDGLAIDAQGETYNILKSGKLTFKVIICEVSDTPRYAGEAGRRSVERLLADNGYKEAAVYQHGDQDIFDIVWIKK